MTQNVPQVIHSPDLSEATPVRNHPVSAPTRLLNVDQVADELGVSTTTVYRLVEQQALAVHHVGRSLRFSRADLDNYLVASRVVPKP